MKQMPLSVKWMHALLIIKLVLLIFLLGITMFCLYTKPSSGFWAGASDVLLKGVENRNEAYAAGYITGGFVINMLFTVLPLFFLRRKKQTYFWVAFAIESLYGLSVGNLPLINIPILILGLARPTKEYFSKKDTI